MINARRSERIHCHLQARISCLGGYTVPATVTDINEHGMFVRTDEPLAPDSLVLFKVELCDGPIDLFGIVKFAGATATGRGVGVSFFFTPAKRDRWVSHYQALAQSLQAKAA